MTREPVKVVYDCNIFVQALINLNGPAGRCLQMAREGVVVLIASPYVLTEVREIHLKTPAKYRITEEQTDKLARSIAALAIVIGDVPSVYLHPYDPDDSHYIDLALKAGARLVVSRDKHLLMLNDVGRKEGQEFRGRFPTLRILDPVEFLCELDSSMRDQNKAGPPE